MSHDEWMSAEEAGKHLGVRAQTLYAYASRGLLRAAPNPDDARRSLYRRSEVAELAARKARSRKLADVASAAIAWGEPVLQSAITRVQDERFTYRGVDAVELSEHATLESAAALLIGVPCLDHRGEERLPPPQYRELKARLYHVLAGRAAGAHLDDTADQNGLALEATQLLDLVADAAVGTPLPGAIHQRLAQGWDASAEGEFADLIRRTLVLLADHELNASTFAARVTASTGAPLAAALLSGLAALSGPRHGGMGAAVRDLAREAQREGARETARTRLADGGSLPGFGHPLYPQGDIRAKVILARIKVPAVYAELREAASDLAGIHPNVDFALAAVCSAYGLPDDASFALFATARTAGWLAHVVEQRVTGQLIRPRARYVGR